MIHFLLIRQFFLAPLSLNSLRTLAVDPLKLVLTGFLEAQEHNVIGTVSSPSMQPALPYL